MRLSEFVRPSSSTARTARSRLTDPGTRPVSLVGTPLAHLPGVVPVRRPSDLTTTCCSASSLITERATPSRSAIACWVHPARVHPRARATWRSLSLRGRPRRRTSPADPSWRARPREDRFGSHADQRDVRRLGRSPTPPGSARRSGPRTFRTRPRRAHPFVRHRHGVVVHEIFNYRRWFGPHNGVPTTIAAESVLVPV